MLKRSFKRKNKRRKSTMMMEIRDQEEVEVVEGINQMEEEDLEVEEKVEATTERETNLKVMMMMMINMKRENLSQRELTRRKI